MKIHLGVNITSQGTPKDVKTKGILEIEGINEKNIIELINNVLKSYVDEIKSIEMDISKTRSL
jgi:hypothetical protein